MLGLLMPLLVMAEITPVKGKYDPRVRIVEYNPLNVVKLVTFYGVSSHVQFGDDEAITDIAIGDEQAWKVAKRGNHLFIKPQAQKADTNITVLTTRRVYQFALVVQPRSLKDDEAWSDRNLIFSLKFRYPDEEAANLAVKTEQADIKKRLSGPTFPTRPQKQKAERNTDYWAAGSEEISPTRAEDDGRFIYLTFSNNRDMPAIYGVDAGGDEFLINTHVTDGNTIVVQKMVSHLVLRKGRAVASIINKSFDIDGGSDNKTGTVVPDVRRVVREGRQ
ncbi:MAG: P-type conjugative transfer protein VirB9 [Nitrosospira sp.]